MLITLSLQYNRKSNSFSAKLKTHRKLPCALLSAFENSASEFTKRTFDEPAQNRLNKSEILNAKGLFPTVKI